MNTRAEMGTPLRLCLLAGANYLIFFGLGVFLARALGAGGFGSYSFVVAAVTMLASLATLGLEKYALRAFTAYLMREEWSCARGYVRFSMRIIFVAGLGAALLYLALNRGSSPVLFSSSWQVFALLVILVPSAALVLFLLEMLSAAGNTVGATAVYRLLLPAGAGTFLGCLYLAKGSLTVFSALVCYGAAWILSLAAMLLLVRRTLPAEIWKAVDTSKGGKWLRRALPFLLQSFMMTQFANLGVVVLGVFRPGDFEIGLFAACVQVAGFAVLVSTSTGRYYAPLISICLDRKDWGGLMRMKRQRHSWLVPTTLVYLAVILLFGRRILSLYGPGFEAGYPALCVMSAGVASGVVFAMAPYLLQFAGKASLVLWSITAAGLMNFLLLLFLAKPFGASGTAVAYTLSLGSMSMGFYGAALFFVRSGGTANTRLRGKD